MKNILITGENSYIGSSFENWFNQFPQKYEVKTISVKGKEWLDEDFSKYDTIIHVAGIAHIKETLENKQLYNEVNNILVHKIAEKAKQEGIQHFIFLSSMSVYGEVEGRVTKETKLNPNTYYGKSKLDAEEYLQSISSNKMSITIVRPPMVYGNGCKGNYISLSNISKKIIVFPNIDNKRSMIYIDNLALYMEMIVSHKLSGLFCPQNKAVVNTSEMVGLIAEYFGKKIYFTKVFNPVIRVLINRKTVFSKVFGSLYYDESLSVLGQDELDIELQSRLKDFKETIAITEGKM